MPDARPCPSSFDTAERYVSPDVESPTGDSAEPRPRAYCSDDASAARAPLRALIMP